MHWRGSARSKNLQPLLSRVILDSGLAGGPAQQTENGCGSLGGWQDSVQTAAAGYMIQQAAMSAAVAPRICNAQCRACLFCSPSGSVTVTIVEFLHISTSCWN